jgi:hypothetical protein
LSALGFNKPTSDAVDRASACFSSGLGKRPILAL